MLFVFRDCIVGAVSDGQCMLFDKIVGSNEDYETIKPLIARWFAKHADKADKAKTVVFKKKDLKKLKTVGVDTLAKKQRAQKNQRGVA